MPLRPIDPIARQFGGKVTQYQSANYAAGGGTANAYTFALKPPVPGPVVGMPVRVKIPVTNTGASTLNGIAIKHTDGTDVVSGELRADEIYDFVFNGTVYQLQTETVSPGAVQKQAGNYAADTGSANAYVATFSPAVTAHTVGMPLRVKIANTCNGASTFNPGPSVKPIVNQDGSAVSSGQIVADGIYTFIYDGTSYQYISPRAVLTQSITSGDTEHAPSSDTVFNSLKVKLPGYNIANPPYNGTGSGNKVPAFNAALADAGANTLWLNELQYQVDSTIYLSDVVNIRGIGSASGPGTVDNANCSQILANYATGDVISAASSLYGSTFKDFQVNSNVGKRTSGAALYIDKHAINSAGSHTIIDNISFNNQYNDIYFYGSILNGVYNTYHQAWKATAITSQGDGTNESGLGFAHFNYLRGDSDPTIVGGVTQPYGFNLHDGYHNVGNNVILGSQIGYQLSVDTYPAGAPIFFANWVEEHDVAGAFITGSNGKTSSMGMWSNNEFSVFTFSASSRPNYQAAISIGSDAPVDWMTCFQVNENRLRYNIAKSDAFGINLQAGTGLQVNGNLLEGLSSNTMHAVIVGANLRNADMFDNKIFGAWGRKYDSLTTEVMLRDFGSRLTVADVAVMGTPADGSLLWVTDADPANPTLTGSSTGSIVTRIGGAWRPIGYTALGIMQASANTWAQTQTFASDVVVNQSTAKLRATTSLGVVYIQAGNADPSTSGGKLALTGWLGTDLDSFDIYATYSNFVRGDIRVGGTTVIDANRNVISRIYTYDTLPAHNAGLKCMISDGTASPTFAAIIASAPSGSTLAPVYSDGTNWRYG